MKEEDQAEEQELPREVSSVQFRSSTPTTMGRGFGGAADIEVGLFSRATRPQYGGKPDTRTYKASVVSPALRGEVEWVKNMTPVLRSGKSTLHSFLGCTARVVRS